jgi:hypothetical protein
VVARREPEIAVAGPEGMRPHSRVDPLVTAYRHRWASARREGVRHTLPPRTGTILDQFGSKRMAQPRGRSICNRQSDKATAFQAVVVY